MSFRVLVFAQLAEALGWREQRFELSEERLSVGQLRARILKPLTHPPNPILVARNQRYCDDADLVEAGDEIAFIPPVSGG